MYSSKQQGFSLFMVMIIMLVIALLVVVASQSSTTELRISANEADRKYALSLAENALRDAENTIKSFSANSTNSTSSTAASAAGSSTSSAVGATFTYECLNGNCAPVEDVHWESDYNKANPPSQTSYKIEGSPNTQVAWKRKFNEKSVFDDQNRSYPRNIDPNKEGTARYIIEFLGERKESSTNKMGRYFRVTARAKGNNPNTVVMLQSYVELTSMQ